MTKNPSWLQSTDDIWGEAVGGSSDYKDWLRSLDAPNLPASALDPLPDVNAPLRQGWIAEQAKELVEAERMRVIGPHGVTFQRHADMLAEVAHLDAARRTATGDLRDQITRQHREAKQELSDFERGDRFQSALRHYLDAAGPAFERIAAATPENPAAVLYQQEARVRYEALIALTTPTTTEQKQPPEGRHRRQEQEILAALRDLGYDPKALPAWSPAKPGAKADVRGRITSMTQKVFEKAWERLLGFEDIAYLK